MMTLGGAGARVRVVGLGNVLMSDDAFGPWVIHYLAAAYAFDGDVALIDAGTPGGDLVPHLHGADAVVLVDTVRAEGEPGTLRRYTRDDLLRHAPSPRVSPHDPGLKEALLSLEFAGGGPRDVVMIGAVPGPIVTRPTLSAALHHAVPQAAIAVFAELRRLGITGLPKPGAIVPPPWWEAEPDPAYTNGAALAATPA